MKNKTQRIKAAKKLYIQTPQCSKIDENDNVWCYDDEDKYWISITGEYRTTMPGKDYFSEFVKEAKEYEKRKEHFSKILSRYENASKPERQKIASYAYWHVEDLPKTPLYTFCGVRHRDSEEFKKVIDHPTIEVICPVCDKTTKIKISAFGDIKQYKKDNYIKLCEDCREKQANEKKEEIKQYWVEWEKRAIELDNMSYGEYLKTKEWQKTRKRRLRQANYKCEMCGKSDCQLHVHHNNYPRRGSEQRNDLIVLCKDCHEKFHNKQKEQSLDL